MSHIDDKLGHRIITNFKGPRAQRQIRAVTPGHLGRGGLGHGGLRLGLVVCGLLRLGDGLLDGPLGVLNELEVGLCVYITLRNPESCVNVCT